MEELYLFFPLIFPLRSCLIFRWRKEYTLFGLFSSGPVPPILFYSLLFLFFSTCSAPNWPFPLNPPRIFSLCMTKRRNDRPIFSFPSSTRFFFPPGEVPRPFLPEITRRDTQLFLPSSSLPPMSRLPSSSEPSAQAGLPFAKARFFLFFPPFCLLSRRGIHW